MASMTERIKGFLKGPQGRKMTETGRRQASKPATQQKLKQFASRITGKSSPRR